MPRRKNIHTPLAGEVFSIPLEGGKYFAFGEILAVTPKALNSVLCIFYSVMAEDVNNFRCNELTDEDVISVQFVTPDLLKEGIWGGIGINDPFDPEDFVNLMELQSDGFIGVAVI